MNKYSFNFRSFRRLASIFAGLLLIVYGGFSFLGVSAETESVEQPAAQNLVLGKLAFSRRISGGNPSGGIIISNPDGSERTTLTTPMLDSTEPAWSPDATKLAFNTTQPSSDIYVINADGSGQTNLTNTQGMMDRDPSWSVTGKIAYERSLPNGTNVQIWVINPDGSGNAQFPNITQSFPSDPAWSPDGTKLAFRGGSEIWLINSDGTNERRVAVSGADPAWSPDGTKIVFTKNGNGIAVINVDGTNETILASNGKQPSWSPDGTKIAFRGGSSGGGVYTMDANGANPVRIVADTTSFPLCCDNIYENPAWQPVAQPLGGFTISGRVTYDNLPVIGAVVNLSGTVKAAVTTDAVGNYQFSNLPTGGNYTVSPSFIRHYFTPANRSFNNLTSNQSGSFQVRGVCYGGKCVKNGKIAFTNSGTEIYTVNPDGTSLTNITNNTVNDFDPSYSPDGASIVFTTNRDGTYEIYRMNADGSNPVRLTSNAGENSAPNYSPDGSTIVFVSTRDGGRNIYKMNTDGTNQVRLTDSTLGGSSPAFSPDGRKIIFLSSPASIFMMNADGSNRQQIPNSSATARPSYSPDGSEIVFEYTPVPGSTHPSVWTINADGTNRTNHGFSTSPAYSADGMKRMFICCFFEPQFSPPRVYWGDIVGGSSLLVTPTMTQTDHPTWQPLITARRAPFDFDADGRSDLSVFRPSNSAWYLQRSTDGLWVPQWGLSTDVLTPADYDGDLKTDVAVWRPSEGNFYILNSFDNTVRIENFGLSGDVPTGGDWDGDGKADLAVYRGGAQSVFYYRGSMGNPQGNITFIPWGTSGDKAVAGDYDGDARTDAAIYRNGTWWIRQSSNGQAAAIGFGLAGDTLVPADYDADGKTDLAVYREGVWYLMRTAQGFTAFQFGISTDTPAPADYDGDGKADAAIYRNGVWWILKSQSGTAEAISFGFSGDTPIPSAFVR